MDGNGVRGAELDDTGRHLALVRERFGRKLRRPGKVGIARTAPAAARGEAAEPSDGVTEGDGRDEDVGHREERHPVLAHVPDRDQHRADEAAVEDEPALPEGEDARRIPRVIVPVDEDEEDPRADHRRDEDPERQVHHPVAIEPFALRRAPGDRHRHEERGGDEKPVGVQRDDQGPGEREDAVVARIAQRSYGDEQERCRPGGPESACLHGLLPGVARAARYADLPAAHGERDGEEDEGRPRGLERDAEQDGKHVGPCNRFSGGLLSGDFRLRVFLHEERLEEQKDEPDGDPAVGHVERRPVERGVLPGGVLPVPVDEVVDVAAQETIERIADGAPRTSASAICIPLVLESFR